MIDLLKKLVNGGANATSAELEEAMERTTGEQASASEGLKRLEEARRHALVTATDDQVDELDQKIQVQRRRLERLAESRRVLEENVAGAKQREADEERARAIAEGERLREEAERGLAEYQPPFPR